MQSKKAPIYLVSWKDGKETAVASYQGGDVVLRTTAAPGTYRDVSIPNTSVREEFSRDDYDYFRPGEAIPTEDKPIQAACMQAYNRFGVVRNVVDMMSDFVTKGIDVVHPSPRVQKFGKEWWKKVRGAAVSGRIASILFRAAAAPVRRKTGTLPEATLEALRATASAVRIPTSYAVLNPATVEVIGGELAPFVDPELVQYGVRIPDLLAKRLKYPKTLAERQLVHAVPKALFEAATTGDRLVPLDPSSTEVVHYKKDDFALWAKPILYPLLDDLQMLNKLKQADRSALDGAISHIRLWRLGSLEHGIFPTPEAIAQLAETLLHNVGGGVMDLIWGPELDLVETSTEIHRFLGSEKYTTTLAMIFQGLGVPPTLTGTASETGFTNNFVSLRVLVERLNYCRSLLVEFWEKELAFLQKAFGFREAFRLTFDIPALSDDSTEKKLLIELVDRNLVSPEFVLERFGADPEIEAARLRWDARRREKGQLPERHSPLNQQGSESSNEGGRPIGAKDSAKRKQRVVKPVQNTSAEYARALLWATDALQSIEGALRAPYLGLRGKKNLRQLSDAEASEYEDLKFGVLCAFDVGDGVNEASVDEKLMGPVSIPGPVSALSDATVARFMAESGGRAPTLEQSRHIRAMVYALWKFNGVVD